MNFSNLAQYEFDLPRDRIRKEGVEPRDSARLFVYDTATDTVTFDVFRNVAEYLPSEAVLVLNDTKVLPARLWLKKETGGKIEVLVLINEMAHGELFPVIVDRKVSLGQRLFFENGDAFEVVSQSENIFLVRLLSQSGMTLVDLLLAFGETPIPHYLEGASVSESALRQRYQTIFASAGASVAAPTASLHFTEEVFASLEKKGIRRANLTLNVGLGTFAPLREASFLEKRLHGEYVEIPEETAHAVGRAKEEGRAIISVGTTTTRTLEWSFREGQVRALSGMTDIFIFPPYQFQVVDILLTNFHLPKSSLLLLVDAFLQQKQAKRNIIQLYTLALQEGFSFYSFGDSMLIR